MFERESLRAARACSSDSGSGQAPLAATVYELESLRCNLCGEVYEAEAPEGVGEKKYDESAAAMIGLLKYGSGVPFYRLAGAGGGGGGSLAPPAAGGERAGNGGKLPAPVAGG